MSWRPSEESVSKGEVPISQMVPEEEEDENWEGPLGVQAVIKGTLWPETFQWGRDGSLIGENRFRRWWSKCRWAYTTHRVLLSKGAEKWGDSRWGIKDEGDIFRWEILQHACGVRKSQKREKGGQRKEQVLDKARRNGMQAQEGCLGQEGPPGDPDC